VVTFVHFCKISQALKGPLSIVNSQMMNES